MNTIQKPQFPNFIANRTPIDGRRKISTKFYFTNPKHIPADIPERERLSDWEMDRHHQGLAEELGRKDLGEVGRVRDARVDTGTPTVRNLRDVQVATFRVGLNNADFELTNIYWQFKRAAKEGQEHKYVVVLEHRPKSTGAGLINGKTVEQWHNEGKTLAEILEMGREQQVRADLRPAAARALRALATTTWGLAHVWDNIDGTVTVNLLHRKPDMPCARHALVVRNREIAPIQIAAPVTEDKE